MLIRRAGIDDVEQLRLLYQELEEDGVRYQPEHFVVGERSNEFFQSVFESADQDILVAEEDGKILGFSHVMILEQKKVACLKPETLVYIQGIGTLLMEASKRYGKEHGVDFIRTQVFPQNIDGMRFYEKNGFREMMKTIESSLD